MVSQATPTVASPIPLRVACKEPCGSPPARQAGRLPYSPYSPDARFGRGGCRKRLVDHKVGWAACAALVVLVTTHTKLVDCTKGILLRCPHPQPVPSFPQPAAAAHPQLASARQLRDHSHTEAAAAAAAAQAATADPCPASRGSGAAANLTSEDFLDIPPGCLHLADVCVDQGNFVLFEGQYRVDAMRPVPLPRFTPDSKYNYPYLSGSNPDALQPDEISLPHPAFRVPSNREPTEDLQHPVFDTSAVPLVLYPTWPENYGHTIGNHVGWLYSHVTTSSRPWARHVALKLATPFGLALPSHWPGLMKPLGLDHIETLAEFSARGAPSPCRPRCFKHLLMCSADSKDDSTNSWQAAQYIADWYKPKLPKPPVNFSTPQAVGAPSRAASPAGSTSGSSSYGGSRRRRRSNSSSPEGAKKEGGLQAPQVLRVLFPKREGNAVRQLLNLDELVRNCSRWRYTVPDTGRTFAASCGSWTFKDQLSSIAVAQSTDVLIGMHGATIMNSYFMPPGSSVVEIFPPSWVWNVHRTWIDKDPKSQLQWWGLIVKDPKAFTPGALELLKRRQPGLYRGTAGPYKRQRDRNVRVPWAAVDTILKEVAGAWGNMTSYREEVVRGHRHQYLALPDRVSVIDGPWPGPCLLRPPSYDTLPAWAKRWDYCDV